MSGKYYDSFCFNKEHVRCTDVDFLIVSPPRRIRKDHLPSNPRRLRRKKKEVLEGRLKRRFVVG
jgi:hypothetical protein